MEWQAGYACGAFLMPATALREIIRQHMNTSKTLVAKFALNSSDGEALITLVAKIFQVSHDAARVRLLQRGALVEASLETGLFD